MLASFDRARRQAFRWPDGAETGNYKSSLGSGFPAARNRIAGFLVGGAAALGFALVPELLALGDGQLHLDPAVLEIHPSGNKCEPLLLDGGMKLEKLGPMDEQLARAPRIVIELRSRRVDTNVGIEQRQF